MQSFTNGVQPQRTQREGAGRSKNYQDTTASNIPGTMQNHQYLQVDMVAQVMDKLVESTATLDCHGQPPCPARMSACWSCTAKAHTKTTGLLEAKEATDHEQNNSDVGDLVANDAKQSRYTSQLKHVVTSNGRKSNPITSHNLIQWPCLLK